MWKSRKEREMESRRKTEKERGTVGEREKRRGRIKLKLRYFKYRVSLEKKYCKNLQKNLAIRLLRKKEIYMR